MENDGHPTLIGTEVAQDYADDLDRFVQLTWPDVTDLTSRGVSNDPERRWLLTRYDYYKGTLHIPAPHHIRGLEARLRADIFESLQLIEKKGGLTAVSSMKRQHRYGELSWAVLQDGPHILAANFREGQLGWISGPLGTGKTALGVSCMEQWMDMGNRALSNIKTQDQDSYTYVSDAMAMLLEVADILDEPMPDYWLMVFDELYVSGWSKPQASTSKSKELDGFARCIRKLGGNLVVIEQLESKVPTTIEELSTSRYFCHRVGGGVVTVDLRGPYRHFLTKLEDFPLTGLNFETKDFAFFPTTETVDFDALYMALSKVQPNEFSATIRKALKAK